MGAVAIPLGSTELAGKLDWGALRNAAVWAGALGYLVDIYDLNVGSNFRTDLFASFGIPRDQTEQTLIDITGWARWGILLGGFLWGILGDRVGRVFSLFGSIAVYSLAVLVTAMFCHTLVWYKVNTFFINLGLAGELGGSVTLVLESLPGVMRTFGVMLVAALGMLGVVIAGTLAEFVSWRTGFAIGGVMGLALLIFRLHVRESLLFERLEKRDISRGNWFQLLWPWARLEKYLACIFLGVAPLFVLFFYSSFAPELGRFLHWSGEIKVNRASVAVFMGIGIGDLLVAWLSYRLQSRKRPLLWFMGASAIFQTLIWVSKGSSSSLAYLLFFLLGMATANALCVTMVSEQFGTNVRDTATTTITNFFRFGILPLSLILTALKAPLGFYPTGFLIALGTVALGVLALSRLRESYGSDVEFVDQ